MSGKAVAINAPMVGGDPRRPAEAVAYVEPKDGGDQADDNFYLMIAQAMAMIALFLKVRMFGWGALFLALSSFTTSKSKTIDYKQLITATTMSVMGIASAHIIEWRSKGADIIPDVAA